VRAELEGPYARLTPDGRVRIILPDDAGCTELGPTEGPVFVIGNLSRYSSTALEIRATPALPARRPPQVRGRHDPARYDRYIVDPAYMSPEERRRREEGRDDRP
jgi:hypothetical protein